MNNLRGSIVTSDPKLRLSYEVVLENGPSFRIDAMPPDRCIEWLGERMMQAVNTAPEASWATIKVRGWTQTL